jgi:uncharacterized membrane protein
MGLLDQAVPNHTEGLAPRSADRPVQPGDAAPPARRVHRLFSVVLLGAAIGLLVHGAVFAALGHWFVAALSGGLCLCLLAIWRANRRMRASQTGHGRHRAVAASTEEEEAA